MKDPITLDNNKQQQRLFNRRILVAVLVVFLIALIIVSRLVYLQLTEHRFYSTLSQKNILSVVPIEPNRGLIYDRNGILIAENKPVFSLMITPVRTKNLSATIKALRQFIDISEEDVDNFQKRRWQYRPYQPNPLKTQLTEDEVAQFSVNRYRFPGVSIQARLMRIYPYTDLLSNVIGYVGRINEKDLDRIDKVNYSASDYIGKVGIEKQYEKQLHGKVGSEEVETDASSRIVRILRRTPPVPGQDLYLSIDVRLQQAAYDALGDETGAVVALDPQTGEVLALVTKPSYDSNLFVKGISQKKYSELLKHPEHPLYNRDVRGLYAPGSTIKPFYALKALDSGLVTTRTRVFDPGWFQLPTASHRFRCWKRKGHGSVDLYRAIVVSCDTYFYTLAARAGINSMDNTLSSFGLGKKTGIDLPEELSGLVPSPRWKRRAKGEPWYGGDTIVAGIGQGFLMVTPLQLAQATAVMARHGLWVTPHLLMKSRQADGTFVDNKMEPKKIITLKNPEDWDTIIKAMVGVIKDPQGTATRFGKDAKYTAAGKTGTAQVYGLRHNEEYVREDVPRRLRDNKLFIAFAPVEDPQIAVAVVVEHASGADVVARKVMDFYLNELKAEHTGESAVGDEAKDEYSIENHFNKYFQEIYRSNSRDRGGVNSTPNQGNPAHHQ